MSDRATKVAETLRYAEQLALAARQQKQTAECWFGDWLVRAYFGPSPDSTPEVPRIAHSACAVNVNVGDGVVPIIAGVEDVIRVDFDNRSVLWMSAATKPQLTRKLKTIFPGFKWSPSE